ncbi:MAG: hypothetical protein KatS3mg021_1886 [Fimbriimonadales bacterium]|nr:MAG: hypothetical protein KatS3mg021_1886 [Fimbriimonadales bacterium]
MQNGCTTHALNNITYDQYFLHRFARTRNTYLAQIHQILVDEQAGCFPCAWHDHRWVIEDTVGGGECNELGPILTEPFATSRLPLPFGRTGKARLDEMRGMGFADSWCGRHRYLNFANNQYTDRYLRFFAGGDPRACHPFLDRFVYSRALHAPDEP